MKQIYRHAYILNTLRTYINLSSHTANLHMIAGTKFEKSVLTDNVFLHRDLRGKWESWQWA